MKVRNGFVSNSSSSSFVIDAANKTVLDVAFSMVPARDWKEQDEELLEKLLMFNGDHDSPIAFRSCNFNTFIAKINNIIFVETCNNHPWQDFIDYRQPNQEELKLINEDYEYEFKVNNLGYYWWPEYGITAKTLYPDYDWCKDCMCDILQLQTGQKICPKCLKDRSEVGRYNKDKTDKKEHIIVKYKGGTIDLTAGQAGIIF